MTISNYRWKVKGQLTKRLLVRGFCSNKEQTFFERIGIVSRDIVYITLSDTTYEIETRCQPIKEGWTRETYAYTYENVAAI